MSSKLTLFEPPPADNSKAPIENVLELTPMLDFGPDIFTNTRPLWRPPKSRGIFGGYTIGHSLSAAQRTVPKDLTVHSMHCYFILPADSEIPIIYHVERIRDGRSFMTRTVQARQRGRSIFTAILSFSKDNSSLRGKLKHVPRMPDVPLPQGNGSDEPQGLSLAISRNLGIVNRDSRNPADKRFRRLLRARGKISDSGGHQAHLSAFAYFSDSYFIGTVLRVHDIPRFSLPIDTQQVSQASKNQSNADDAWDMQARRNDGTWDPSQIKYFQESKHEASENISMIASLNHTIYFHNPREFRADEWMLMEMECPWADEGRGLVMQRVWSMDGVLIATCIQEGIVRLRQDWDEKPAQSQRNTKL